MVFETPADLARAFEAGDASVIRWQKTCRHAGRHGFDSGSVVAALTSPAHLEIAHA